jgi:prevent-host-death family protein
VAKKIREVAAGEFSARCLTLLDEVAETGDEIVVTKNGTAVARIAPIRDPSILNGGDRVMVARGDLAVESPSLLGSVVYEDDIVSPLDEPWAANDK